MSFGDLRSLLHAHPTPESWTALCDALDRWPDPCSLAEQAIPYARDHLAAWPEAICAAPAHWLLGPDDPRLQIVCTIWISADSGLGDARGLRALHRATLPRLSALRAAYTPLDHAAIDALCDAPWLPRLTTLQLDRALLTDDDARRLATAPLTALRRLDLRHNQLSPAPLNELLALPALEHLSLEHNKNMLQPAISQVRWREGVKVTL